MKALNNLKTSVKLIGSFLLIAILTGVIGGTGTGTLFYPSKMKFHVILMASFLAFYY